jgi:hypothetical protein
MTRDTLIQRLSQARNSEDFQRKLADFEEELLVKPNI